MRHHLALLVVFLALCAPSFADAALQRTNLFAGRVNDTSGTIASTSPTVTVPANSIIVVSFGIIKGGSLGTTDVTNTGTALNWTRQLTTSGDGSGFYAKHEIWTAPVTGSEAITITISDTATADVHSWVFGHAVAYTGYDTADPIGGSVQDSDIRPPDTGAMTLSEAPTLNDVTIAANYQVPPGSTDPSSTPGAGWSELFETSSGSGYGTLEMQERTASTSAAVVWVDIDSGSAGEFLAFGTSLVIRAATASGNSALSKPPNNLGLIGYWSFDEATGVIATDFSGNGKTGSLSTTGSGGASWIYGKRRTALEFDGTDDYVAVGSVANSVKTISFWMRADDTTSRKIMDIDGTDQLELNGSSQVTATSFPGTTVVYIDGSSASSVVDTDWHHVLITDTTGVNVTAFDIGRVAAGYFDGKIDEVRMYSRVLSSQEIAGMSRLGAVKLTSSSLELQRGSSLESGLAGLWTFDGPDITTNHILDRSGQGKHGGFYGGATSTATTVGKLGQGFEFDGSDDYLSMGAVGNIQTVAFWLRVEDRTSREIIQLISGGEQIELNGSSQVTATGFSGATVYVDGSTSSTVVDSGWRHVVVTNSSPINSTSLVIGNAGGSFLEGVIDDVRVYDRALTASEVRQLYRLGTTKLSP